MEWFENFWENLPQNCSLCKMQDCPVRNEKNIRCMYMAPPEEVKKTWFEEGLTDSEKQSFIKAIDENEDGCVDEYGSKEMALAVNIYILVYS